MDDFSVNFFIITLSVEFLWYFIAFWRKEKSKTATILKNIILLTFLFRYIWSIDKNFFLEHEKTNPLIFCLFNSN